VIVLAHAGHWLVQLAYLLPLGALVVAMLAGRRRERRERLAQERASRAGASSCEPVPPRE
jgi:hypothetical protein